jgi:hypothetical protein
MVVILYKICIVQNCFLYLLYGIGVFLSELCLILFKFFENDLHFRFNISFLVLTACFSFQLNNFLAYSLIFFIELFITQILVSGRKGHFIGIIVQIYEIVIVADNFLQKQPKFIILFCLVKLLTLF